MTYKVIYENIYRLHSKYGRVQPGERNDEYWVRLNEEISAYCKSHDDSFTTALIVAVLNKLERESCHYTP
jgi:hypothetical protein